MIDNYADIYVKQNGASVQNHIMVNAITLDGDQCRIEVDTEEYGVTIDLNVPLILKKYHEENGVEDLCPTCGGKCISSGIERGLWYERTYRALSEKPAHPSSPLERLIIEKNDLDVKIKKLALFLISKKEQDFCNYQLDYMKKQLSLMEEYSTILTLRIGFLKISSHKEG